MPWPRERPPNKDTGGGEGGHQHGKGDAPEGAIRRQAFATALAAGGNGAPEAHDEACSLAQEDALELGGARLRRRGCIRSCRFNLHVAKLVVHINTIVLHQQRRCIDRLALVEPIPAFIQCYPLGDGPPSRDAQRPVPQAIVDNGKEGQGEAREQQRWVACECTRE